MSCSYIIISDQIHNSKITLSSLTLWRRISSLLLKTHFHPVLITSDRSTVKACEHRSLSLSARTKLSWQPSRETERNECQMGAGCVSADGGAGETGETVLGSCFSVNSCRNEAHLHVKTSNSFVKCYQGSRSRFSRADREMFLLTDD